MQSCKGETPIEKNIVVTDADGKTIGSTYPKRAKGLVKNGRAEYADDQTICLRFTRAPTAVDTTEEHKMSKVINFNAREFRLDETCVTLDDDGNVIGRSNVGERAYQTTSLGSFEMWEIGDWGWNWTQIVSEKKLEKNTDYILRFAMTGGHCDTFDETSKVILNAKDGYDTPEAAWEDRMTFDIAQSKYEPVISKRDKTGLLRVFEIPFYSGEHEEWEIRFVAMHAVARFFASPDNFAFEKLEDFTYDDWRREREQHLDSEDSGLSRLGMVLNAIKDGIGISAGNKKAKIEEAVAAADTEYDEKRFAELLRGFGDGAVISLGGIKVSPSYSTEFYDIGGAFDGAVFDIHDADITAKALSMIIKKLGDGCVVNMSGIKVTSEGLENMYGVGKKSDGVILTLDGATLPQKALDLIYSKRGDGCAVYNQNLTVK